MDNNLFELNGVVEVNLSEEEFFDKFVDFVESLGGTFGGGITEVDDVE